MQSNGRAASAALTLAVSVALAGCGSDGIDNARYLHDADAICKDTRVKARSAGQPRSMDALSRRLLTSHAALYKGANELHALGERLGDEPSTKVAAFQRRITPVVSATLTLADDAELADRAAVRKHAESLRRRSASLFNAAQAAGLKQCGRGGNRAADGALFVAYRGAYLEASEDVGYQATLATELAEHGKLQVEYVGAIDKYLSGLRTFRDELARLAPPRDLRRPHRVLMRRIATLVRRLQSGRAGFQALPSGAGALIATLKLAEADERRADRAETRLRQLLTPRRSTAGGAGDTV